jgi:hypothetical protein
MTNQLAMEIGPNAALSAISLSPIKLRNHEKRECFFMSHHLDTPLAAQNGQLFIDDLYVFSAADSTVFIMDVNSNITGVHVKPGFIMRRAMNSKCTSMRPISKL